MDSHSFNDPLIYARRSGGVDNPYIDITESLILDNNAKVTLTEIPSIWHGLAVEGENQTWFEIRNGLPKDNEYIVDYSNRQVTFNKKHIGKQFSFSFKGTGNTFTSASSVYTKRNGLSVTETLQEIVDNGREGIQALNELSGFDYVNEYSPVENYYKHNIVSFNGATFISLLNNNKGNTPPNPNSSNSNQYWGLISKRGEDGIGNLVNKTDIFTATEGQSVFQLNGTYTVGKGRLEVIIGGVPQHSNNFTETNSSSFTLSESLPAGTEVVAKYTTVI
ncbi:hypothetical protein [Virgibacillus halodenitrificans]|uniref:Uncharacterized protein n=1 Tax=Virgibacillus halodenitrificans TaxID=1482 RepID=A0ABR7VPL1_VIRHA|nr:hypothetical protein [Virgibacillus halodenitrificans]MBD1222768.1 hypothetical protein [Virgibacillus halodenitrificans]